MPPMSMLLNPAVRRMTAWNTPASTRPAAGNGASVSGFDHSAAVTNSDDNTSSSAVITTVILVCSSRTAGGATAAGAPGSPGTRARR